MTAPATTRRAGPFNGNGVTTAFPFTFKVFATSDIAVVKTSTTGLDSTLVLGSDYSVALNADQDASPGGTITYPISGTPLAVGEKLTAIGALPYDQTADLPTGGNYRAIVVENALDRTVMQIQQLAEEGGRALRLPLSAADASTVLPTPEANKVLAWNPAADALQNVDSSTLASIVAFGTATADVFTGDGATLVFALSENPGVQANLDVSLSGVTQVPGIDYVWASGTSLVFLSAPPPGATILARYMQGLPQSVVDLDGLIFNYNTNYVSGTLASLVKNGEIDPTQSPYNADPTGTDDCSAALAQIWADFPGHPVRFPAGNFKFTSKVEFFSTANVSIFGPGARLRGAGIGVTFIENGVLNDVMWDFNADQLSPINLEIGLHVSEMTIRKSGTIGTNSAIRIGNGYHVDLSQLHIFGGYIGVEMVNGSVADDGWNMLTLRNTRIENCTQWGIKADGSAGRNEGSFTTLSQVFVQACGTAPTTYAITGITKAAAAQVSAAGHPFVNGDDVYILNVGGMTEVSGRYVAAGVIAGVSFTLKDLNGADIDSTAFTTYSSGGTCELIPDEPTSGGIIYKGQILKMDQCAWTLNQNAGLFIRGQAGLTVGVYCNGCTWENNNHRHILCTGVSNWQSVQNQFHANTAFPHHTGVEFRGDFTVRDVNWLGVVWRNNDTAVRSTAFRLAGSGVDFDTCRVDPRFITWDNYDLWSGHTRFDGWRWDTIPRQCRLAVTDAATVVLRPSPLANGATMPIRMRGGSGGVPSSSGEWAPVQVPSAGRSKSNSGLAAGTRYYVYFYDNGGTSAIELSTTAWAVDTASGYLVMSGDATKLYVGSVLTDGAAGFTVTGTGWLNPEVIFDGASQAGVPYYRWRDGTGDVRVANAVPTSDTDGAIVGTQT